MKLFRNGIICASAAMLMACNNAKSTSEAPAANAAPASNGTIAYVEIDSLMTQYQFAKDYTLLLTKKSENARATLNSKARKLETDAQDFQNKINNNAYTQERAQQENNRLVKMQQDLQELQNRLAQELDEENLKYNNAMRDSLQAFLKEYNKQKGFTYILSKAGDNMLLADPALNITQEVVDGLNKRYKPTNELKNAGAEGSEKAE